MNRSCSKVARLFPSFTLRTFASGLAIGTALAIAAHSSSAFAAQSGARTDIQGVIKEYDNAVHAFMQKYNKAKNDQERAELGRTYPQPGKTARQLLKLAHENPEKPEAIDALVWIVQRAGHTSEGKSAIQEVEKHHLTSDRIAPLCASLAYIGTDDTAKLLRKIRTENPNREVKGTATFSLAQVLNNKHPQEAEELFEEVIKDFSDIKQGRGTLADMAKSQLYELRNLAIGKPAPEIEGEDVDGNRFKLSDYRGKVVVIDFWGDW